MKNNSNDYRFIDNFLGRIYELIQQTESVQNGDVKGIYFNVNNREEFPCVYIIINAIEDKSKFDQKMYEIEFEISIHSREQGRNFLTRFASEIKRVIMQKNCSFHGYDVIGLTNDIVNFDQARDLISNKMTMQYKAMITSANFG